MVGMEVGHRVIALVPVHVDHAPVERADTRHGSTAADSSAAKWYPPGAPRCSPSAITAGERPLSYRKRRPACRIFAWCLLTGPSAEGAHTNQFGARSRLALTY